MHSAEVNWMPPDDRLIYLIFTAQQKLRTHLGNVMVRENVRVTPAQAGILFLLAEKDGRTMSELSRILSIDNSTLTGLVDRLEKAGLARRDASPNDRRASHVYISPEGTREMKKARSIVGRVNREITDGFTPEELTSFKKILRSFFHKFDTGSQQG
ncbi:MAG: MarR family transcriptional regulator [Syntrophaceae bacterium]|nr:MarR family transcriptional regulator [Syntrophaceae bacterium]